MKWIKLLHLMYFYVQFIFVRVISWLHLLLEWFWSLVKLHTFQCSHNCLTNGNFESKIWKTVKIREKILIFRGKVALLAGDQNIFIFKGGCPIRVVNFLGGGPPLCTMVQEGGTQWWGWVGFTKVEWGAYLYI